MKKPEGLLSYGLFFTGLFFIMLSVLGAEVWQWPIWTAAFIRDFGLLLSAVVAGTILHEKLLREEMLHLFIRELERKLDSKVPKLSEIEAKLSDHVPTAHTVAEETATAVHNLFCIRPPGMTGIRFLQDTRRGFSRYYSWVNEPKPQDLFFAGRSVLHRIDADIREKTGGFAEDIIFRRLVEGSKIKILLLDPRIDIIDRLASEEAQSLVGMLTDIATSVGICERLAAILRQRAGELKPTSELYIRLYDRVPYFAYHKQDDDVIVGFYFLSEKGYTSAAYELIDDNTKRSFGEHFAQIYSLSSPNTLVSFDGARGRPTFDDQLFRNLTEFFRGKLGEEATKYALGKKQGQKI